MPRDSDLKREEYLNSLLPAHFQSLISFSEKTDPKTKHMQIMPFEGNIIALILKLINAKKALEVGTLNGYSAAWILNAMGKEGKLDCLEIASDAIARAQQNLEALNILDQVNFVLGDAKESMNKMLGIELYDAIFIDADKASYMHYLNCAKQLVRKGGVIILDNVFLFGSVYDEPVRDVNPATIKVMREVNESMFQDGEFCTSILPTQEGMMVSFKL